MSRLSIIVPCYNCQNTLSRCVESLKTQNYNDLEIVLVDDGSKDQTAAICDEYAASDNRIRALHKNNGGLVSAWKAGVEASTGQYILFCDSDDYVDSDLCTIISDAIKESKADIILFGMTIEYDNGDKVKRANRLEAGYYDRNRMTTDILPSLLSNGKMESELVLNSRSSKAFKKGLLTSVISDIPNEIKNGEDAITTFVSILNASSLECIGDYYPYHYVRTSGSMVGAYDPCVFDNLDKLYDAMWSAAGKYNYIYDEQIYSSQLSMILMYAKKEISRNPGKYSDVKTKLSQVRDRESFGKSIEHVSINGYTLTTKVFSYFIIHRLWGIAYCIVKICDKMTGLSK